VLVKEGMLVTPQIPLAIIGNTNSYYLELEIDENDLLKIENGQQVMVSMDSYKGQVFEALITQINPLMNERNRTFTVEAQFKNAPKKMYPNLTVEANIIIATKKNTLTIPKNYLLKGDSVWINETTKRKIKLGISDYENVEVLSGLRKNELIYKP
jgi:multidrug efflux pump subunit AcrA (membrane-fusion protein)